MAFKVVMPQVGITTLEAIITRWIKKEGDRVEKGEPLFEIMTDKVNMEVESPASGVVRKILAPEGATVKITEMVAIIGEPEEDISAVLAEAAARGIPAPAAALVIPSSQEAVVPQVGATPPHRLKISPLARKIARAQGISEDLLTTIQGSGPAGSIVKRDVLSLVASWEAARVEEAAPTPAPVASTGHIVPLSGMRRTIAQRMTQSSHDVPHFYLSIEVQIGELARWRELLNARLAGLEVSLTYTDFLVKASALALRSHPHLNASFTSEGIELKPDINVGVAVAIEDGLIVPVIKNADQKSLRQLAQERADLATKARQGGLTIEDVSGGTFTVSNLGMLGIDAFIAIINPPEAAILAAGRINEKLVLDDGHVRAVPYLVLWAGFDHRVVDGAQGAQFLQQVRQCLEDPYWMLL